MSMEKDALFSGESANVEYKITVPGNSEKYMKTVIAFANGRGGRIIFGVDDKTLEVVGWILIRSFRLWMPLQMLSLTVVNQKFFLM